MLAHSAATRLTGRLAGSLALVLAWGVLSACDRPGAHPEGRATTDAGSTGTIAGNSADTIPGMSIDVGHTLGDPDAPIAVVEFSDFGCPYCARFARATLPTIRDEFIDAGIVRWRYVPVTFGFAGGELMGAAAECAADQADAEAFWEVHDLLYARQVALRGDDARPRLLDWLEGMGLDPEALDACIDDPETKARLDRNNETSREWFVRGTPTFVINGVPMSGALPIEFFRQVFTTVLDPSGL